VAPNEGSTHEGVVSWIPKILTNPAGKADSQIFTSDQALKALAVFG